MKIFTLLFIFLTGCATIIEGDTDRLRITTNPDGAKFTIVDQDNVTVAEGVTPSTVFLKKDNGYFDGADYMVHIDKAGYQHSVFAMPSKLDYWYFGNIIFGGIGIIGMVVVDPITGGMWELPKHVNATLQPYYQ